MTICCLCLLVAVPLITGLQTTNLDEIWSNDALETQEKGRFRRSVPEKKYGFKDELQAASVDVHNELRSSVSPQAANMKKMEWDNALGRIAKNYAAQCTFAHNSDRSHKDFDSVGENIYITTGNSFGRNIVEKAIRSWDNEKADYSYSSTTCSPGKSCGHYTQIVWANSYKLGCGAALCSNVKMGSGVWKEAMIVVCNYAPAGNYRGEKPYKAGKPCSECEESFDTCEDNLCANNSESSEGKRKRTKKGRRKAKAVPDYNGPVLAWCTPGYPKPGPRQHCQLGRWDQWGEWSQCSVTCGKGKIRRDRKCSTGEISDCKGKSSQERTCNPGKCER